MALIFYGEGGLSDVHKVRLNDLAKDHQVEYTFQKKGWLDIPTTIWYAENIVIPYVNTHSATRKTSGSRWPST